MVVAARHCGPHRGLDLGPPLDHLPIGEPKNSIAERARNGITTPITLGVGEGPASLEAQAAETGQGTTDAARLEEERVQVCRGVPALADSDDVAGEHGGGDGSPAVPVGVKFVGGGKAAPAD